MKKIFWISSTIIIITILLTLCFLLPKIGINQEQAKWNQIFYQTIKNIQKYPEIFSGTIEGTLRYNGAHKEPYETPIHYEFTKEDNNLTIIKDTGQTTINWQQEYYDLIKLIRNIENTQDLIKIDHQTCNVENINKTFHTQFKNCQISYETSFPKIKNITINLDNTKIILEQNKITINHESNFLTIYNLKNGFSININDILKLQTEFTEHKNIYHLIIKEKSFLLEQEENFLKLTSLNKIENFHSLEMTLKQKENILPKENALDITEFPFLKYLTSLNLPDWRNL